MAAVSVTELVAPPTEEPRTVVSTLMENRNFLIGAAIFLALVVIALVGGLLLGPGPLRSGALKPKLAPGFDVALWLGSTTLGQSVFAQILQAIPGSCLVGLLAALIGTSVGALIGLASGYFGGKVDAVLRVLVDVFLSVPSLLFLILIASLLRGVGVPLLAIIIGLFAWAWPARAASKSPKILELASRTKSGTCFLF